MAHSKYVGHQDTSSSPSLILQLLRAESQGVLFSKEIHKKSMKVERAPIFGARFFIGSNWFPTKSAIIKM